MLRLPSLRFRTLYHPIKPQGVLSQEDDSREKFMNDLLYSDQVQENDFESRSAACLAQFMSQQAEAGFLMEMCLRMFEAWKRKQGETISMKIREFFQKTDLKLKFSLKESLQTWKTHIQMLKLSEQIQRQQAQISKFQIELQYEKEESLQFQKKLQSRNSAHQAKQDMAINKDILCTFSNQTSTNQLGLLSPIKNCGQQYQLSPKDLQDSLMIGGNNGTSDQNSHNLSSELDAERLSNMFKKQPSQDVMRHGLSKIGDSPHKYLSELRNTSSDDGLKNLIERFMKDKYEQSGTNNSANQRELSYLVDFVKKLQGESSECTFHPQVNPKSTKILNNHPAYQMSAKQIYERLHEEGYAKQYNLAKMLEIKEDQDMQECTFSPRTNQALERKTSPKLTFQRLHYEDLENRQEKISKKEAEKMQKFKQDYTFKPERSQTKQKDSVLVAREKENDDKYERLYRGYIDKADKIEIKRQAKLQQEKAMMSPLHAARQARSKSQKKQNQTLEMQTLSHQLSSFFPQTTTNQRNNTIFFANQKAAQGINNRHLVQSQASIDRKGYNTLQNITNVNSSSAFNRLYQNAEQTRAKKTKLRDSIDQELGISFSPKLFKSPSRLTNCSSAQLSVIERNEQFERNKLQKRQEREDSKYSECTFEPTLVSKRGKVNETAVSEVGERLYQNALKQEEKKSRKKLELEQKLKQKYLKKRQL